MADDKKPRKPRRRDPEDEIRRALAVLVEHGLTGAVCASCLDPADGARGYRVLILGNEPAGAYGIVDYCYDNWDKLVEYTDGSPNDE